jgi:hypothetical protein
MHTHTNATVDAKLTTAPIEPGASGSVTSEFLRVPDVEKIFGIKRGHCYALISAGLIKSVCLRRFGAKTGVRLVHLQSLRDYLAKHMEGGKL